MCVYACACMCMMLNIYHQLRDVFLCYSKLFLTFGEIRDNDLTQQLISHYVTKHMYCLLYNVLYIKYKFYSTLIRHNK